MAIGQLSVIWPGFCCVATKQLWSPREMQLYWRPKPSLYSPHLLLEAGFWINLYFNPVAPIVIGPITWNLSKILRRQLFCFSRMLTNYIPLWLVTMVYHKWYTLWRILWAKHDYFHKRGRFRIILVSNACKNQFRVKKIIFIESMIKLKAPV